MVGLRLRDWKEALMEEEKGLEEPEILRASTRGQKEEFV